MSCGHCLAAPTLSRKALVTTAVPAASRTVAGVGLAGSYDDAKRRRRAIQGHYMRFADSACAYSVMVKIELLSTPGALDVRLA